MSLKKGHGWYAGPHRDATKTGEGEAWAQVFLMLSIDKQAGQGTVQGSFVWIMSVASRLQTLTSYLWSGLDDLGQGTYVLNM